MRSFSKTFAAIAFTLAVAVGLSYLHVPPAEAQSGGATVILKGIEENLAYTSGTSVFGSDFTFTPRNGFVRLTVAHSVAAVPQIYLIGASTTALPLNANVNMVVNGLYVFDVPMRAKDGSQAITYNVRLSVTGTIRWMLVEEYSYGD